MGTEAKAIGPLCEKPWKKQGFGTEGTGTELLGFCPMILRKFERYSPWNRREQGGSPIILVVARE
jgi:hypothetical protein